MAGERLVDQDIVPLMMDPHKRDNFHQTRSRALCRPERAQDQLTAYASLAVHAVKARGLIASDAGWGVGFMKTKDKSDPYVQIFLDDCLKGETQRLDGTTNPDWGDKGVFEEFDVQNAGSYVRIMVMDYDMANSDDLLGFVEFPVADLPLRETLSGWFQLFPKEKLQGTVEQRITQSHPDEGGKDKDCGAIYLKLTMSLGEEGDPSDEWYSHCLPEPKSKEFPTTGFQRDLEPPDAQGLYDAAMSLQTSILDGFVRPCGGCVNYLFTWREKLFTLIFLIWAVVMCIFPQFLLGGIFGICALFLISLASSARRRRMAAHPASAPLNQEGYETIAELGNTEKMTQWLERVVAVMHGKVVDREQLRNFAAFAFEEGEPVTTYKDLKAQLREAAAGRDDLGLKADSFIKFDPNPIKDESLVKCPDREGNILGEIKSCKNPKAPPGTRTYVVEFQNSDGTPSAEECDEEDLEANMDLRWMAKKVVRALIPDFLENQISLHQGPVERMSEKAGNAAETCNDIVSWHKCGLTLCITLTLILLGVADFLWHFLYQEEATEVSNVISITLKVIFGIVVVFVICSASPWCQVFNTCKRARLANNHHKNKDAEEWYFYHGDEGWADEHFQATPP